jgi:hypothetical protein
MGQKITDYPNEAVEFTTDDKFDVSQFDGASAYESKWYNIITLMKTVRSYMTFDFVRCFEYDMASMISIIGSGEIIVNARYKIIDSSYGKLIVYGVGPNMITEFAYLNRDGNVFDYFKSSPVGRYDLNSDIFYPADSTITESKFQLLLRYLGGYFSRGMSIDINDSDQFGSQDLRLYFIDENRSSSAAIFMGSQDGGTSPNKTGYFGNYDVANDVFIHDIVHFRTEISAAQINSGVEVPVVECPLPPVGYCWEVLSANLWRQAGATYGVGAAIELGIFSTGRALYSNDSLIVGLGTGWRNMIRDASTSNIYAEDQPLEVRSFNVSLVGTGKCVVHGTARLMKL